MCMQLSHRSYSLKYDLYDLWLSAVVYRQELLLVKHQDEDEHFSPSAGQPNYEVGNTVRHAGILTLYHLLES